jgi:hypothetical protein
MKLTINSIDNTRALDAAEALTIERVLNAPAQCRFALSMPADAPQSAAGPQSADGSLAAPQPMQRVCVAADDGTMLFTGYVAGAPLATYAGLATEGERARLMVTCVSDEILLDAQLCAGSRSAAGVTAGGLVASLAEGTGSGALETSALTLDAPVSAFVRAPGAPFSASAGEVAQQVRAAYRAANGALALESIPAKVHALSSGGTLTAGRLSLANGARRAVAGDITVCGEHEPAAYVTEFLVGDGVTSQFALGAPPWFAPSADAMPIDDGFDAPTLDRRVWNGTDDTHFAMGDAGLEMSGGSGVEGATQLAWRDPVEMGGTLLLEAEGVMLQPGSTGVVCAFYSGGTAKSACVAGFEIAAAQGTGALTLQPLVKGVATGTPFTLEDGAQYTLRARVHCDEPQRLRNTYIAQGDAGVAKTGGNAVPAAAQVLLEAQPCVNGVLGMPVVLFEGAIDDVPAACTVVAAGSLNLRGSLRAMRLANLGSAWVTTAMAGEQMRARRVGSLAESAECVVERGGKLLFYAGFVPAAGEQIAVRYRSTASAVGRASAGDAAGWIGTVTRPRARSSADCRNAAAALLSSASTESALWCGTYRATQYELDGDVWPGDALELDAPWCGVRGQVVVRRVQLRVHASVPDCVEYAMAFANDWAEDLAIKTSAAVPADARLPAKANALFAPNLNAMTASVNGRTMAMNMNAAAPEGGGFEVRRRDGAFVPGNDPGLVARGSQQTFMLARGAAQERYFVRAFDGATPPNYSEFSAAVFANVPLGQ